jgi:hypothetical protein
MAPPPPSTLVWAAWFGVQRALPVGADVFFNYGTGALVATGRIGNKTSYFGPPIDIRRTTLALTAPGDKEDERRALRKNIWRLLHHQTLSQVIAAAPLGTPTHWVPVLHAQWHYCDLFMIFDASHCEPLIIVNE